ncbi:NAD_binding_6 domain-containing protein [Pseudomonas zeae]
MMLKETIFMVGSPGKRAMLADMGEMGQCGVGEITFVCGICVVSNGAIASRRRPTGGTHSKCRSEPARDSVRPVDEDPRLVYTCGEPRHP